ncbi:MAG: C1 family peptidase [Chryseolinea sp.]
MTLLKSIPFTPIKDQAKSQTCWSFSTTSLIESETLRNVSQEIDLSEMFTVRSIYSEKAKNYIRRQGAAQFGPGGLGHHVIRSIADYGAMPESAYSGLASGQTNHDHVALDRKLRVYLDSLLKIRPLPKDWMRGFEKILDDHLGQAPKTFYYKEKEYTARSFAREILKFDARDYIAITSFTHHPFYKPFILEVPDNFENGTYYNLPVEDMLKLSARSIEMGYSLMWDADISNNFFIQQRGYAMQWADSTKGGSLINPDDDELKYDQTIRQSLFENLITQDDHLMHIVGLKQSEKGKRFFMVKNSWGKVGPEQGLINVSEAYFAINTISLIVPRAALDEALRNRLELN